MKHVLAFAALLVLVVHAAAKADAAQVKIELNKLEPQEGACRAYLVLENGPDTAFETLKLDLVMFDAEGVVAKRIAVEMAPLPAGKTSLKVFDINGLPCDRVGRVLLNDVVACADASGKRENCLGLISISARGSVPFIR